MVGTTRPVAEVVAAGIDPKEAGVRVDAPRVDVPRVDAPRLKPPGAVDVAAGVVPKLKALLVVAATGWVGLKLKPLVWAVTGAVAGAG